MFRPMPSPPLRLLQRAIDLSEHVEHMGQHVGGDTHAVVRYAHHRVAPLPLDGQSNASAPIGVLGGVVQQISQHLRQPGEVAIDVDWFGRHVHDEVVALSIDQRAAGIHGVPHGIR